MDSILQLGRETRRTEWEVAVQEGGTSEFPRLDGRPGKLESVFPGPVVKISCGPAKHGLKLASQEDLGRKENSCFSFFNGLWGHGDNDYYGQKPALAHLWVLPGLALYLLCPT